MELRRKQRVSYAKLFDVPSDEEEDDPTPAGEGTASGQSTKRKRKAEPLPESDNDSDVYAPEEEEQRTPSDMDAFDAEELEAEEASDDAFMDEEEGSIGSSDIGRRIQKGGPTTANRKGLPLPKLLRRTPSPPPNAPKRVVLARLAPSVFRTITSTHQAKFSTRFRAVSMYFPPQPKRLTGEPKPYGFDGWGEEVPTTHAAAASVIRRLIQAEIKVQGGPRWELLEDRGWFKEAEEGDPRPRVWENVKIKKGDVKVLSREDAAPYLPSSAVLTDAGTSQPPSPLSCSFGLFDEQQNRTMHMFDSFPMSEYIPASHSHILNTGAPIHGLAWCPIHPTSAAPDTPLTHRLAISTFASSLDQPSVGERCEVGAETGSVQIWGLSEAGANCEMVLCLEDGPAWQIEWCPLPADDAPIEESKKGTTRKMGLLAGCFRSGYLCIYAVPHPEGVKGLSKGKGKGKAKSQEPLYVKLEPIVRLSVDDGGCYCLDWANSGLIAVGCTNGYIAIFDIASILRDPGNVDPFLRLPMHYLPVHQSGISSLAWIRSPQQGPDGSPRLQQNPTMIVSGSYDGQTVLTDIRDGVTGLLDRMRDWVTSVKFSPLSGAPVLVEADYRIKHISIASVNLGRGTFVMDATGPIWDLSTSDFHHQVAMSSADGTVYLGTTGKLHHKGYAKLIYMLYQLDYNRKTGEYRMLENIKPRESRQTEEVYAGFKKRLRRESTREASEVAPAAGEGDVNGEGDIPPHEEKPDEFTFATGAWAPQVSIHRVAWHSGAGMGRAMMLASGGESGLARVDWVRGRWMHGIVPWIKVDVLRSEVDVADWGNEKGEKDEEDEDE